MHPLHPSTKHWITAISLIACALLGCEEEPRLEQLPLSAALDYVERHPEYVIANPEDEVLLHGERPRGADAKLDRHLAGDWVARQLATQYRDVDVHDRISWTRRSVEITQETLASSRSPGIYMVADDCICDPGFSDAAFARLVRGFSNCDGINHALAMLLVRREPDTRLYHLDVDAPGNDPVDGHTLATMPARDRDRIFVDAWADFGVMALSAIAPDVQTWGEIEDADSHRDDLFTRVDYEQSRRVRKVDFDYGERYDEGPDLSIPSDLPPITDARSAYLRARVFDLYGLEDEAVEHYQQAADLACVDPKAALCQLSMVFLGRDRPGLNQPDYAAEPG